MLVVGSYSAFILDSSEGSKSFLRKVNIGASG